MENYSFLDENQIVEAIKPDLFVFLSSLIPTSCLQCSQYYWNLDALKKHSSTHKKGDTDKGPFLCDTCGKESKTIGQLNDHIRQHITMPLRTFECFVCHKSFSRKSYLKCHARLHMANELKCTICQRIFRQRKSLRRHSLIHSNSYTFFCDSCGKGFRTRANLIVSVWG